MEIEKLAQVLIYLHVGLGVLALLTGAIALIATKGNKLHKKAGKIFFYSMLSSAIISLIIATMPKHESPFLFSIGVFSSYFLISGYRSLRFRNIKKSPQTDWIIAYVIIITGLVMVLYPIVFAGIPNIVLLVFGIVGLVFGILDIRLLRDVEKLKKKWLGMHLGKMIGGYIAAITAFFVVNQILPGVWNWFLPGIIGGGFITYWNIRINKGRSIIN